MDVEMVLNELSLQPANDIWTAQQRMSAFLETVAMATHNGVKRSIRTHDDLYALMLGPNYPVSKWMNDNKVDLEARRFFRTLTTKTPFLQDLEQTPIHDTVVLSDPFLEHERAIGLGMAFWLDALAISLQLEQRWDTSHISIRMCQLDEDGGLFDTIENIHHASRADHIKEHLEWIRERIYGNQARIRSGTDLCLQKKILFPHLHFCASAENQLKALLTGDLKVLAIQKKVQELESYCTEWHNGQFDPQKIASKISPESPITLHTYDKERTFLCPDGQKRLFSWHMRLTPGEWRIYFHPIASQQELIIGYIGRHLPTVDYPG
jgi:hypothetical protein